MSTPIDTSSEGWWGVKPAEGYVLAEFQNLMYLKDI